MAHYIRFEVLVPTEFNDPVTSQRRVIRHSEIFQFCNRIRRTYSGLTEASPISPPPLRGYWKGVMGLEVDELTFIMVLVPLRDQTKAIRDFTRWKHQLEQRYNQQLILVMYYPVQILGEL